MKKRGLWSVLLSLSLCVTMAFPTFAAEKQVNVVTGQAIEQSETVKAAKTTEDAWTAEDFTYSDMEQTLNGCDYKREFKITGRVVAGFSESGVEKLKTNKDLVLPSKDTDGTTLVGVADSAFSKQGLESVSFPEGMMVDYDDTLTNKITKRGNYIIGASAFLGNNLTSVYLPEGVIAVMSSAFQSNKLKQVSIPHTIWWVENSSFGRNELTTVGFPSTTDFSLEIHGTAFAENNIRYVRLPDFTAVVYKYAFSSNPGMEACPTEAPEKEQGLGGVVYMYTDNEDLFNKDRIHHIDQTAEAQKSWHQKLILGAPEKDATEWSVDDFTYEGTVITGLSDDGIAKRENNKYLELPDKNKSGEYITEIGAAPGTSGTAGTFATDKEGFEVVILPSHLKKIGQSAFAANQLKRIASFPDTLTEIGIAAFRDNQLTSVNLPDTVTNLGGGAFATNPNLSSIILSKSLAEIPDGAFGCSDATHYMTNLKELTIPENITKIGKNAFAGNNITNLVIPASVTEIGDYAFSTKNYLKDEATLTLNEGLVKIGDYAFRNKVINEVNLPKSVVALYKNTFLKEYSDGTVPVVTKVYISKVQYEDTANFEKSTNYEYSVVAEEGETQWDRYDFTYSDTLSQELTSMDGFKVNFTGTFITGFSDLGTAKLANNKDLVIPKIATNGEPIVGIGASAFKSKELESVSFPEGVMKAYPDGQGVPEGTTQIGNFVIQSLAFSTNNLTSLDLPEGVVYVGAQAFTKNKLTTVKLPSTTWQLGQGAFNSNQILTVDFPETCDFNMEMDTLAFGNNQLKAVQLPKRTGRIMPLTFAVNPGLEAVSADCTNSTAKKGGVVYLYEGDSNFAKDASIANLEGTTGTGGTTGNMSWIQKLVAEDMPAQYASWNVNDFNYEDIADTENAKITGLSESGLAKRVDNPYMVMPTENAAGKVITEIGAGAYQAGLFGTQDEPIKTVTLPSKLEKIGQFAFTYSGIEKIVYPDTLVDVGIQAFSYNNLTEVVLPDSVTTIGGAAFSGNTTLEKVEIPSQIKDIPATFVGCTGTEGMDKLTEITIPEGVTSIGSSAFAGNHFTEITIPESVKSIASSAFGQTPEMSSLSKVNLSEGLESIASSAFKNTAIKSMEVPRTLKTLNKSAFNGCNGVIVYVPTKEQLTSLAASTIHKLVYSNLIGTGWTYDDFTFDGTTVTGWSDTGNETRKTVRDLVIPEINPEITPETEAGITAIANSAFEIPDTEYEVLKDGYNSPTGMKTIKIPDTVTSIGDSAFAFNRLETVKLPIGIKSIGTTAFKGNVLKSVDMPDSLTELKSGAFAANNITELKISTGLTKLEEGVFSMNIWMEQVTIPDSITEIGDNAFAGARLTSLEIPSSVTKIGTKAFNLHHLSELTIPGNVKEIGEYAFAGTPKAITLKKLTLEEGIESIGKGAFDMGYLTSVKLPKSLNILADESFTNNAGTNNDHKVVCTVEDVEQLKFASNASQIMVFGGKYLPEYFDYDGITVTGLKDEYKDILTNRKDIEIPSTTPEGKNVTAIGADAFKDLGLKKVTLPTKLESIGANAFSGNKLTELTLPADVTEVATNAFTNNAGTVNLVVTSQKTAEALDSIKLDGAVTNDSKLNNSVSTANITLSKNVFTYNGKVQRPAIVVKDNTGTILAAKYYTVTYGGAGKLVGQYTVTVKLKAGYKGVVTKSYQIVPKSTKLLSTSTTKKKLTVKWRKQKVQTTGYQVQYSTTKNFKKSVKSKYVSSKATKVTLKKLKSHKKYYVRIRTYKKVKVNGKTIKLYSAWSKVKTKKVK